MRCDKSSKMRRTVPEARVLATTGEKMSGTISASPFTAAIMRHPEYPQTTWLAYYRFDFQTTGDCMRMKITKNLGMLLLSIWLIVAGLITLLGLTFNGLPLLMAILAIAAGVLILIGR